MVLPAFLIAVSLVCIDIAGAHPGDSLEDVQAEANIRSEYLQKLKPRKRIGSCKLPSTSSSRRQTNDRREEAAGRLRKDGRIDNDVSTQTDNGPDEAVSTGLFGGFRDLVTAFRNGDWRKDHKRDPSSVPLSRNSPATGNLPGVDWASYNLDNTLVLAPSGTEGPYFVLGEDIRQNLRDGQDGIPLYLDIQLVNILTCEPIRNAAVDIWQANATGVYGGVNAFGNGLNDPSNIQNRALRGIQISDEQGSVRFQTIIPGHYWPRTPHIHVLTTLDATISSATSTIKGGKVAHVAQIYLDQSLNDAAFQVYPYSANNQIRLRNRDDFLVMQGSTGGADPVAQYIMLGKTLQDGVFAWINFAIDPTEEQKVTPLVSCVDDECKQGRQWWLQELLLRIITSPNVYWRKPPIMKPSKSSENKGAADENSVVREEL